MAMAMAMSALTRHPGRWCGGTIGWCPNFCNNNFLLFSPTFPHIFSLLPQNSLSEIFSQ